jgi:hypothetical protein
MKDQHVKSLTVVQKAIFQYIDLMAQVEILTFLIKTVVYVTSNHWHLNARTLKINFENIILPWAINLEYTTS